MSRRWRVMTRPRAKEREVSAERPRPRPCEPPGPPTIRPTPASATTMARAVRPDTRSCSAAQAISAAAMGETACMKSTFATVVWLRPTMKAADAVAHATATAIPVGPIEENARTTPPRSENETYTSSASTAKNARPATCVAVPTEISRCSTPALDQASAARATGSARGGGRRGRPSPPTRPRPQSIRSSSGSRCDCVPCTRAIPAKRCRAVARAAGGTAADRLRRDLQARGPGAQARGRSGSAGPAWPATRAREASPRPPSNRDGSRRAQPARPGAPRPSTASTCIRR